MMKMVHIYIGLKEHVVKLYNSVTRLERTLNQGKFMNAASEISPRESIEIARGISALPEIVGETIWVGLLVGVEGLVVVVGQLDMAGALLNISRSLAARHPPSGSRTVAHPFSL